MARGFIGIGLINPKTPANVGSAMRAAQCYGASFVAHTGQRYAKAAQFVTDTMKAHRHLPLFRSDNIFDVVPFDCVPVAVDLIVGATSLVNYRHPERAFYIFGPEDGTLGKEITNRCRDKIFVPTDGCMNLAACVNVILYDRLAKEPK